MKKSRTSRLLMGKTYTLQWIKKYDMRKHRKAYSLKWMKNDYMRERCTEHILYGTMFECIFSPRDQKR